MPPRSTATVSTTSRSCNETLLLLIGGDETTRHVISGGLLALLERPDQRDRLADDLEALPIGGGGAAALGVAGEEHGPHGHR